MSEEIDRICERIEAADENTAAEILRSLTQDEMREVVRRLHERARILEERALRMQKQVTDNGPAQEGLEA